MNESVGARAQRLTRGPSLMSVAEQAAAHARFGSTDLNEAQASDLSASMPHGVGVPIGRHLFTVDSEGDPCQVLMIEVGGFHLLIWTYHELPDRPQVFLHTTPGSAEEAWRSVLTQSRARLARLGRAEGLDPARATYLQDLTAYYGTPEPQD